jgi:hypothetical protein
MSKKYLNFTEVRQQIPFEKVLHWLSVSFIKTDEELIGEDFIVNIKKNIFTDPKNSDRKGDIICFLADFKKIDLRSAAIELKEKFESNFLRE